MKIWNSHIIFNKNTKWKSLEPVWGDMLRMFFEETKQFRDEPEKIDVIVEENMVDIRHNRKPEGFNRDGRMRIVVPMSGRVEFFVYRGVHSDDVRIITENISKLLADKGFKHKIEWNDMLLYQMKKRRR